MQTHLIVLSMKNKHYLILILALLIQFCAVSQQRFNKQNFAEMYNTNGIKLHPKFQVFHHNDTASTLFYQVDISELKYKMNIDSIYFAKAKIHYQIYYNYKAKELVDSGSYFLIDSTNYGKDNSTLGYIDIPLKADNKYLLLIEFTDENQEYSIRRLIDIDKRNKYSRQNFYIRDTYQLPFLKNYINRSDDFELISRLNNYNKIQIRYFKPNNNIARPPMLSPGKQRNKIKADTMYQIVMQNGQSNTLRLSDQGYYHFYFDSTKSYGYTLYRFTSDYPYITTPMQMIMPMRYITNSKEFKSLYDAIDKKKAVEKFWVKISGDKNRAQNMIKLYYNRVQNANINFTSDKEGWKTDRGMIFIIYGAPDIVYRDSEMETWVYGSHKSSKSIKFDFYRIENPFTENVYLLNRSQKYAYSWNNAIEVWRR